MVGWERIETERPQAGERTAVGIWASGRLFGCHFEGPVSSATLSAVELKSAGAPAPELTSAIAPTPSVDEAGASPVIDEAFGARLQRLRTKAGLSQDEVATRKNGRANVCTRVTNAHPVCRILLQNTNTHPE